jgi:3-oxoacyl-[acyl-carrier-protein] synthase-3
VATSGGDVSIFNGWDRACRAGDDDHPSTMGAAALEAALQRAGVPPTDLKLVIYSGSSRDYVPSWSVANEIMRLCGVSDDCLGLDMTAGCLATIAALDLIHGWLAARGGGHAAVVAAERWSQTIDPTDPTTVNLWAYGDSAGAMVVGVDVTEPSRMDYLGSEFRSASRNNGHILIPYGGTRIPQPPPGVNPNRRQVSNRPKQEITGSYRQGYRGAFEALRRRFKLEPDRFICNQLSPQLVGMLTVLFDMSDRVVVTGHQTGHLGGPDVIVGLDTYLSDPHPDEVVLMGASAAYGFGTGFLIPPGTG